MTILRSFKLRIALPLFGIILLAVCSLACLQTDPANKALHINPKGNKIKDRIGVPPGYSRVPEAEGSFAAYLRNISLKPDGTLVHYFDGSVKDNNNIYVAVIDMPIGNKNLQQCADVIMHQRAQYLFDTHQQNKIHFTLTNGFRADYSKWEEGYRIKITGNNTEWEKATSPDSSLASFAAYMDYIYDYCGTLSLAKELKSIPYRDLQPGDVFIKGGSPGHAELVMDVAQNSKGKKIYLLAQGYMPAQDMQLLANPQQTQPGPWYELDIANDKIITPEWTFNSAQLMRFEND